jgi:hypothetical protein
LSVEIELKAGGAWNPLVGKEDGAGSRLEGIVDGEEVGIVDGKDVGIVDVPQDSDKRKDSLTAYALYGLLLFRAKTAMYSPLIKGHC